MLQCTMTYAGPQPLSRYGNHRSHDFMVLVREEHVYSPKTANNKHRKDRYIQREKIVIDSGRKL